MPISQIEHDYRENGVVRVRNLLSPAELDDVRRQIDRYRRDLLPQLPNGDFTLEPDGQTVRNFWRMEQHDPYFLEFARRPALRELVARLVNGDPILMGVETFNKPAQVGTAVPCHQDNAYFCQSPPDVLTVWIAVDAATAENGAVEYLLGSHHALQPHVPSGVKGNSFGLAHDPSPEQFKSFLGTVDAGDALIHHCQTIHRSQPNRSARSRQGLVLVYRGRHTQTDPRLQAEYHKALTQMPQNA